MSAATELSPLLPAANRRAPRVSVPIENSLFNTIESQNPEHYHQWCIFAALLACSRTTVKGGYALHALGWLRMHTSHDNGALHSYTTSLTTSKKEACF